MERVSLFCFAASYLVSLGLMGLWYARVTTLGQSGLRVASWLMSAAGLIAHSLYLWNWQPPLAWQFGGLLVLAWFLAAFHLYESAHPGRLAWSLFLLPLVLVLVGTAALFGPPTPEESGHIPGLFATGSLQFWNRLHAVLLLAASVTMSLAFIASLMFLVRARQLKAKVAPGKGLALFTLERLEGMNRRSVAISFPLLSAGMGVGLGVLLVHADRLNGLSDPRILAAGGLWLTFVVLLVLRYGARLRGSVMAWMTIVAYFLLIVCLLLPHTLPTVARENHSGTATQDPAQLPGSNSP